MSELVIRIGEDEKVMIEETENGVKQVKFILMEDLTRCISQSVELKLSSGLLPDGCISYSENASGGEICSHAVPGGKGGHQLLPDGIPGFPFAAAGVWLPYRGKRADLQRKAGHCGKQRIAEAFHADVPVPVFQCQPVFPVYGE